MGNLLKITAALSDSKGRDRVRGVWIVGEPGLGKSHYARSRYGDDIYLKAFNKWWDGYSGQSVVILDDLDRSGQCLGHLLKIWSDKYACDGEVKGGRVGTRH